MSVGRKIGLVGLIGILFVSSCTEVRKPKSAKEAEKIKRPAYQLGLDEVFLPIPEKSTGGAFVPCPITSLKPSSGVKYFEAWSDYVGGRYIEAENKLKVLTESYPDFLPGRQLLLRVYLVTSQWERAEREARTILKYKPYEPYANYVVGMLVLERENKVEQAIGYFYRAYKGWFKRRHRPAEFFLVSAKLAGILAAGGYIRASFEVYQSLIEELERIREKLSFLKDNRIKQIIDVYLPTYYLIAAQFALRLDEDELAEHYFTQASKIRTVARQAEIGLINLAIKNKKKELAKKLLRKFALTHTVDKDTLQLYKKVCKDKWLGEIVKVYKPEQSNISFGFEIVHQLVESGRSGEAVGILKKILEVDPNNSKAFSLLLKLVRENEDFEDGIQTLIEVFSKIERFNTISFTKYYKFPEDQVRELIVSLRKKKCKEAKQESVRLYLIGFSSVLIHRYEQAIEYYRKSLKCSQRYRPAYSALAWLLYYTRRWKDLDDVTSKAIGLGVQTAEIYYLRSVAKFELNELDDALEEALLASKENPLSDKIQLMLCQIYLKQGKVQFGFGVLRRMINDNIIGPETIDEIVDILLMCNSRRSAEIVLERYKKKFGKDEIYTLLSAQLEYLQDYNVDKYRKVLDFLMREGGIVDVVGVKKARLEYELKNYRDALIVAEKILSNRELLLAPRYFKRLAVIAGEVSLRMLQYEKSERYYNTLINSWPKELGFKLGLVNLYFSSYQTQKAIPLIKELIKSNAFSDKLDELREMLVACFVIQKKYLEANKVIDSWIKNAKHKMKLIRLKVRVLLKMGEGQEAIEFIDCSLKKYPQLADELIQLKVSVLIEMFRFQEAERIINRFSTDDVFTVLFLAKCYQKFGNYNHALKLLKNRLKGNKLSADERFLLKHQLARTLMVAERFKEAEEYIEKQLKVEVRHKLQWQQLLIGLYFITNRSKQANEILELILKENPNLSWVNNSLGYSLAEGGEVVRGEQLIRRALMFDPGNPAYLDSLGWVLFKKGEVIEALKFVKMGYKGMELSDRQDPILLDHLGDIYAKLGDIDRAIKFYREALKLAEKTPKIDLEPDMPGRIVKKLKKLIPPITSTVKSAKIEK